MISNINDISYFLQTMKQFRTNKGMRKRILYPFIKIPSSRLAYSFDYDEVYKFCLDLDLLKEKKGMVMLTRHGLNLVDMKNTGVDLTDEQIMYIVQNCIFDSKKFSGVQDLFKKFVFEQKMGTFIFPDAKIAEHQTNVGILSQLNVIRKDDKFWILKEDYLEYVEQLKQNIHKPLTQKQLDAIILEQKKIGELAEKLTVKYEIKRLTKQKLLREKKYIKRISNEYANKGYDIESFYDKKLQSNLFIEVKGRKYNMSSFIISINEIKTAEALGDKYAIYFWKNLSSPNEPEKPFKIIRNPFNMLSFNKCKNCLSFLIEILD